MTASDPVAEDSPRRVARPRGFAFGIGHVLALVGGIVVIVSIFLKWEDLTVAGRHQVSKAKDIPVQFLFNYTTNAKDPSFVVILAVSAVMIVVGVLLVARLPGGRLLALLGGALAIAVAAMYAFQVHQALRALHLGQPISVTDFVGIAPYFALGGGILALVGAVLPAPAAVV